MWLTVNDIRATEIDTRSVEQILNLYPEEKLAERKVFREAFIDNSIELKDLKSESEKVLIPWQLFLLEYKNLKQELKNIENQRIHKVSAKLLAKRRGKGEVTSKRIIDRLIRMQNFVSDTQEWPKNPYCGSLIDKRNDEVITHILSYFAIDIKKFREKNKRDGLSYLIQKIENRNINVSQGVLAHKILPHHLVVAGSIYKNTSGFALKNEYIPFIFLPSETNPDETEGRQIYTLVYLLVLIGLNQYDFFLEKELKVETLVSSPRLARIHGITSELLLPNSVTNALKERKITKDMMDGLAVDYNLTPRAVLFTLWLRGHFSSREEYEALLPPSHAPTNKTVKHSPNIDTSVKKFCGKHGFLAINGAIKSGLLKSIQAQYLIFGAVNKKEFKDYRKRI